MVQHRVWVALGGGCGLCGDAEEGLRGGRTVLRVNAVVLTCVACFLTRAFMLLDLFQVYNCIVLCNASKFLSVWMTRMMPCSLRINFLWVLILRRPMLDGEERR